MNFKKSRECVGAVGGYKKCHCWSNYAENKLMDVCAEVATPANFPKTSCNTLSETAI